MSSQFNYLTGEINSEIRKKMLENNDESENDILRIHIETRKEIISANNIIAHFIDHTETIDFHENPCTDDSINDDNSGGEGFILKCGKPGLVAKIYWDNNRTELREEKVKFMIKNQLHNQNIIWPVAYLEQYDKFIGFLMPIVDKKSSKVEYDGCDYTFESAIGDAFAFNEFFKNDKRNVLKFLINLLDNFNYLHSNNIVIGDFKNENIVIDRNDFSVKMIDMDSVQVDKFPCIVSSEGYNPPEVIQIYKKTHENCEDVDECCMANEYYHQYYSTFFRDYYSIAKSIFECLTSLSPFVDIEDLAERKFQFDPHKAPKEDFGQFFKWYHVPGYIRVALFDCFTTDDSTSRLSPIEWKKLLECYLRDLDNGVIEKLDEDCYKPIPLANPNSKITIKTLDSLKCINKKTLTLLNFSFRDMFEKIKIELKNNNIEIPKNLYNCFTKLNKTDVYEGNNIKLKLLFNIGVLKKVEVEFEA